MKYQVEAHFTVAYLDLDDRAGDGLYKEHRTCQGVMDAPNPTEAKDIMRQGILTMHPGCWKLTMRRFTATPVTEAAP